MAALVALTKQVGTSHLYRIKSVVVESGDFRERWVWCISPNRLDKAVSDFLRNIISEQEGEIYGLFTKGTEVAFDGAHCTELLDQEGIPHVKLP